MKSGVSLTYDGISGTIILMCSSTKEDIFSVGLLLPLTLGLPVIVSLCIFGRKYQAGVVQSVGTRNSKIYFVISSLCKAFNNVLWISSMWFGVGS